MTSLVNQLYFAVYISIKTLPLGFLFGLFSLASPGAYGYQQTESDGSAKQDILATVNGKIITRDQVARDLKRTLGDRKLSASERKKAMEVTTQKLVDQHVALDFLSQRGLAANPSEVDFQIENLKSELQTIDLSFAEFLKETYQTSDELRFQTKWQISWERYLKNKFTDEFLESYFERSKRRFNGTEIQVAHLLVKLSGYDSPLQEQRTKKQLLEIRNQILSKSISWQEAVKNHSDAPTRLSGGSLGWITLKGPMPPSFTNTAFELLENEISYPVRTKFGFHLIKCEAVRDSSLGWKDVRVELEKNASRELLEAIVKQHKSPKTN